MKKNIVIVLLTICVLGLGGFLVYDKVLKEEKVETFNNKKTEEKFNVDLAYEKYINNLVKFRNNETGPYGTFYVEGIGDSFSEEYFFEINKNGDLITGKAGLSSFDSNKIDSNVVNMFLIESGQGGDQSLYYLKEDGTLYFFYVPDLLIDNELKIKKTDKMNVVSVYCAGYSDEYTGSYGPVFVDIEGNISE